MAADCEFSLVIPAFNEAGRILPSLRRATEQLMATGRSYEITVVDDGSSDDTLTVCAGYAAAHPEVRVVGYPINRGKGYAVKTGVELSRGKIIAFSDADMPVPPEDYARFGLALARGYDLAIGSRYLPSACWNMSVGRRLLGTGFRLLVKLVAGTRVSDTQFGFKAFNAGAAKDLFSALTIDGFAFDAEILRLAQLRGYRIAELPVMGCNAPGSKVRPLHDSLAMMLELLGMRFRRQQQRRVGMEADHYPNMPVLHS